MTQKLQGAAQRQSGTRYFSVPVDVKSAGNGDSVPTTEDLLPSVRARGPGPFPKTQSVLSSVHSLAPGQPDKAMMRILRMKQLVDRTNLSRATLYVLMSNDPTFPKRIKLTVRSIGFLESEVDAWIAARAESRNVA
ncbi:helix-turn-helix transcriptional regulator [Burkholderia sp. Ed8]|uniref:helix-turn-helix transcriptional regulator n=1 Tax=Burkholderia sp. Ed8 TaxID=3112957 RepID=UPI00345D1A39